MSYATASDFAVRYATRLSAEEVSSHVLPHAAARLESLLGAHFPVPFAANNVTARDLTLDLGYLLVLQRSNDPAAAKALDDRMNARIASLIAGQAAMLTSSGEALFATGTGQGVWSNTADQAPRFTLRGQGAATDAETPGES